MVGPGGRAEAVNSAATMLIVGILKLTFTACLAFGTSTATLVSQSLGAGRPDLATRFGWVSVRLGLIVFGVVGVLEGVLFTRGLLRHRDPEPRRARSRARTHAPDGHHDPDDCGRNDPDSGPLRRG